MSVSGSLLLAPYKGLAPFEDSEVDALLFFGREREREVIVANLLASKLTVLYGPSGVGKSSILRAGVARRLRDVAPFAEIAVLDDWTGEPMLPDPADEAFLIFDQFEEYFLYHERGPLHEALPALLERPHVHVLLALREDALARLDAFQALIPNVLANRLHLDHLDASAARAAIVGPLDRWNAVVPPDDRMGIETKLVDAVLAQVTAGPDRIEAPYLQLVMERIWDEEREAGSSKLRASTLGRLGGARAIVSAHLERALSSLPPREAEIATSALKFLVTPSRTKISHSFDDLVGYTDESPVELQDVLERLASQRILRAVEGERYEIFHDVLAEPVLAWRREFEAKAAVERERAASTRRHRRLTVLAVGATLLAAALALLTVYAFAQRGEAGKQRRAAQVQADNALGQKELAQKESIRANRLRVQANQQRRAALTQKHIADRAKQQALTNARAATASARQAKASEQRAKASEQRAKTSEATAVQAQQVAQQQQQVAQRQATRAEKSAGAAKRSARVAKEKTLAAKAAARRATAGELVAKSVANLSVDAMDSIREAVAAAKLERTPRVEDALRTALQARRVNGILRGGSGPMNTAVFSPDGSLVATGVQGGWLRLFRSDTHDVLQSLQLAYPVLDVAFSPDGRTIVAGTGEGARLVDVARGEVTHTLPQDGAVLDAAFAGGGTLVVTGGADKTLRVWDAASGALLRAIPGSRSVRHVAVSPDGSLVAVGSTGDPVARVYSLPSGDLVKSLTQQAEVTAAAFSPSGGLLVTTGRRNGYVWNTDDWSLRHLLVGHEAALTDVVFAADGRAVTSSIDSSARVWDPLTGASLFVLASQHQQKVLAVAVSPDGTQIATASADETARLWKSPLGAFPTILAGHRDAVNTVSYSPDGRLVLTASADGTARLWNPYVPALAQLGSQPGAVSTVAYSPDGRLVLSAGADAAARLWGIDGKLRESLAQGARVNAASFVDAGKQVLTAGEDGTAKLWRVANGALSATFAHGAPVREAVALPGLVVTGGADGGVHGWTRSGGSVWSALQGSPVTAMAENGTLVATGGVDGAIRLWRARDGLALRTLGGHGDAITSLAFDPGGELLASGSADDTARIWNVSTGAVFQRLAGHQAAVTSVTFNPAGDLLLTASVDGDAVLWRVKSGSIAHRLRFHVSTISQASFSPDGRWVVTAGPTTAGLWQVRTGTLFYYLGGLTGQLLGAAFGPDSERIAVGTSTGTVGAFFCTLCAGTPSLLAQAQGVLRELRPSEPGR
jgi:WD40 repeat protein